MKERNPAELVDGGAARQPAEMVSFEPNAFFAHHLDGFAAQLSSRGREREEETVAIEPRWSGFAEPAFDPLTTSGRKPGGQHRGQSVLHFGCERLLQLSRCVEWQLRY